MRGPRFGGQSRARCGIDLGSGSVKVVRGDGNGRITRITHLGIAEWDPDEPHDPIERAAGALHRVLGELGLAPGRLGRIAVAVRGEQTRAREVTLPRLTEAELRQALPYEARRHLDLEEIPSPILSMQILGDVAAPANGGEVALEEGAVSAARASTGPAPDPSFIAPAGGSAPKGEGQIRVLLAAVAREARGRALETLRRAGLDPEVIDLESLASLNALLAALPADRADTSAICLLNLGARQAGMHLTQRQGGFLTRSVAHALPREASAIEVQAYARRLVPLIEETLTFYRGKQRQAVRSLYLAGGGALLPGLSDRLARDLELPVQVLDPLPKLALLARGYDRVREIGPRFVTACGLSRWWDDPDV